MTDNTNRLQFLTLTDTERKLFDKILKDNTHLSETHHFELYAWCKLAMRIAGIGESPTREDLRFISEFRLLSNALKLNPKTAQEATLDLATRLQQQIDD